MQNLGLILLTNLFSTLLNLSRIFIIPILSLTGKTKTWDIKERFTAPVPAHSPGDKKVIWIHAASLGETKLAAKFISILSQKYPDDCYFLTATTRAGVQRLKKNNLDSIIGIHFLPVDTLGLMKRTLKNMSVRRVWLMELELWPSMLWSCYKKKIPVGIVNARMEQKSFERYRRLAWLFKSLYTELGPVFAQTDQYADRFKGLGIRPSVIKVTGNLKSHISVKPADKAVRIALRTDMNLNNGQILLTAGCIHPGEGTIIRDTTSILAQKGFPVKCIAVPRHLKVAPSLLEELGENTLHLKNIKTDKDWDICLIEKFGILEDMYSICDTAFVGGTFVDVGGHNVWDAAQFGVPVFFGPDFHTQRDGCIRLINAGVGFSAQTPETLASGIINVCKKDKDSFIKKQLKFSKAINETQSSLFSLLP